MFGYVTICREHLSEEGYSAFKSYYCGLCREIGKRCSQGARLGLSYDITFLAIVLSSLANDGETNTRRCPVKAGKPHPCVEGDRAVGYAADMGVLLTYLKLLDDWNDEKSIKSLFAMILFRRGMKKSHDRYPQIYEKISECLNRLNGLEKSGCAEIDKTADCFAKILEILFTPDFITDEKEKRALAWLGYNIGRWIYIIDAFNDIEKDIKDKSYNTFLCRYEGMSAEEVKAAVRETIADSLTFTLENAASAYNLLNIKRNSEVMENIIYAALKLKQNSILGETDESL